MSFRCQCVVCDSKFTSSRPHANICSGYCRRVRRNKWEREAAKKRPTRDRSEYNRIYYREVMSRKPWLKEARKKQQAEYDRRRRLDPEFVARERARQAAYRARKKVKILTAKLESEA